MARLGSAIARALMERVLRAQKAHAEAELRRSKEYFRRLVETVKAVPWELDPMDWRLTYVGPQVTRLLGYNVPNGCAFGEWIEKIPPEDRSAVRRALSDALLRTAAEMAAFVVVDLPSTPSSAHRACARMCDPFLLVMERERISVAAGRNLLPLVEWWGLDKSTLAAVLATKNPLSAYLSAEHVSAELGMPVAAVIPPAAEALDSAYRKGSPLVIAEPGSLPADSLKLLAQRIAAPVLTGVEV